MHRDDYRFHNIATSRPIKFRIGLALRATIHIRSISQLGLGLYKCSRKWDSKTCDLDLSIVQETTSLAIDVQQC